MDTAENTDTESNQDDQELNNTDTEDSSSPNDTAENTDTEDTDTQTNPSYDEDCEALISETFPDPTQWEDPATIAQEVKDCCQLAAEYYDMTALQADGSYDWTVFDGWEYRDQCCSALEWQPDTMACTPWGPPMPPKFRTSKFHRPKNLQRILVRHA
jgi:hypothetical protein